MSDERSKISGALSSRLGDVTLSSKANKRYYGRPSQEAPREREERTYIPQIMAHGYLGTTDANTRELTRSGFEYDIDNLGNLTGREVELWVILQNNLKYSYKTDNGSNGGSKPTLTLNEDFLDSIERYPCITLKSMGHLVREVTGAKKPSKIQYKAIQRDLESLGNCYIRWRKTTAGVGEYYEGLLPLVVAKKKNSSGQSLVLYFHHIVLEMERYLTLPPTIFDEVRRRRGGNSLPDYFYRLIMLQALHGGRGTKPYNKRTSDLIKAIGLDKVTDSKRKRAKGEPLRLLTEALTILADPEIGLISGPSITPQVVKWQTGPRGRAPKQTALEVVPPPLLPAP